MEFKTGNTHKLIIGHPKPYKIHICSIVDKYMIVYKYYGKHKQRWHYSIKHHTLLESGIERTRRMLNARHHSI